MSDCQIPAALKRPIDSVAGNKRGIAKNRPPGRIVDLSNLPMNLNHNQCINLTAIKRIAEKHFLVTTHTHLHRTLLRLIRDIRMYLGTLVAIMLHKSETYVDTIGYIVYRKVYGALLI